MFVFQADKVAEGELWRLITAHFCHTNSAHLLMNVSALALLLLIFSDEWTAGGLCILLTGSALFVGGAYLLYFPAETTYLGLSGVLHGVAMAGGLLKLKRQLALGLVFVVLLVGKLIYELNAGASADLASLIEARVATEAHAFGALAGLIFVLARMVDLQYLRKCSAQ